MQFYDMLMKYYDDIFPYSEETYRFLKNHVNEGEKILDIGSATGSYVKKFDSEGFNVLGVDRTDFMRRDYPLVLCDMSDLPFKKESFDMIYSIGNTLVHAKSRSDFAKVISSCISMLKSGGKFIFQILNYDKIFGENIKKLPTIETDNLSFERDYEYENLSKIVFKGSLKIKKEGNYTLVSETELLPITFDEIKWVVGKSGSNFVQFYGDFSGKKFFKTDSFMNISVFYKK